MSKFFDKIKDAFSSKKSQKYKIYDGQQIKIVAMKTRIILNERMELLFKAIKAEDQKFKFIGQDSKHIYAILQSVGEKVVEAESIKILIEMLRKIENSSSNLAKTNGDISLLKAETGWYQCILWYRRQKQIGNLEDINSFCLDFFKGVDITRQVDINCEVFKIYPIIKYLKKDTILPLHEVLFYMQPYVSCSIDKPTLDAIFSINQQHILQKNAEPERYSLDEPKKKYSQSSNIGPTNPNYIPLHQQSAIQANSFFKPQEPPRTSFDPKDSSSRSGNIKIQADVNPWSQLPQTSSNNNGSWIPSNEASYPAKNTLNIDGNNAAFHLYHNTDVPYSNYPFFSKQNNIQDHNPFSNSKFKNINENSTTQPINHINLPEKGATKNESQFSKPIVQAQKKSFFNTLIRTNSQVGRDHDSYSIPRDNERQLDDFKFSQTGESYVPFNRQSQNNFESTTNRPTLLQIQERKGSQRQKYQQKKKEIERKEQVLAQESRISREMQAIEQVLLEKQKIERENELKLQLQKEAREKEEDEKKQRENQHKRKQLEEIQRIRREFQESQRIEQELREKEKKIQLEKEREESRLQLQRQIRLRERENEEERELDVFIDNERERTDREYSGRFSSNIGFKYDFGEDQPEGFNYSATNSVNSSLLKFSQKEVEQHASLAEDWKLIDGSESVGIIEQHWPLGESPSFKLFFSKRVK